MSFIEDTSCYSVNMICDLCRDLHEVCGAPSVCLFVWKRPFSYVYFIFVVKCSLSSTPLPLQHFLCLWQLMIVMNNVLLIDALILTQFYERDQTIFKIKRQ